MNALFERPNTRKETKIDVTLSRGQRKRIVSAKKLTENLEKVKAKKRFLNAR